MKRKTKTSGGKPKIGRPSLYDEDFHVNQAFSLALLGATEAEMARIWETSTQTIDAWKKAHPEFLDALTRGKDEADANVGKRLYERAMGYSHDATKIFMPAGADAPVYAPYVEHYPPDTTAAIFWLKNRQKAKWRDVRQNEVTGQDGGPVQIEAFDASKLSPEEREALRALLMKGKGQ